MFSFLLFTGVSMDSSDPIFGDLLKHNHGVQFISGYQRVDSWSEQRTLAHVDGNRRPWSWRTRVATLDIRSSFVTRVGRNINNLTKNQGHAIMFRFIETEESHLKPAHAKNLNWTPRNPLND